MYIYRRTPFSGNIWGFFFRGAIWTFLFIWILIIVVIILLMAGGVIFTEVCQPLDTFGGNEVSKVSFHNPNLPQIQMWQWRHNACDGVSNHRVSIVYPTVCLGADQRKRQSSASLAFVWGIHRWRVDSPHKGPVTRNMFPLDNVIIKWALCSSQLLKSVPWAKQGPGSPFTGTD